jgi:hypothetical protein
MSLLALAAATAIGSEREQRWWLDAAATEHVGGA